MPFAFLRYFFRVIREKLPQKLPHKSRKLKHTPAYSRQQKSLEMLNFKALCVLQDTVENRVWWRRGESNPRPKVLYKAFYILSRIYLESYPRHADRQAFREPVTLSLISCQVTR